MRVLRFERPEKISFPLRGTSFFCSPQFFSPISLTFSSKPAWLCASFSCFQCRSSVCLKQNVLALHCRHGVKVHQLSRERLLDQWCLFLPRARSLYYSSRCKTPPPGGTNHYCFLPFRIDPGRHIL